MGEISESLYRPTMHALDFRYVAVSKPERFKGDEGRKSSHNFGLFDPCKA